MVVEFSTILMPFLGGGLFLRSVFAEGMMWDAAILSVVAALVSMIPQGLMLLTSTVLAIATTRLGAKNVLVQQSYCVETLARVDTVCLDKTGTITSGRMELMGLLPLGGHDVSEVRQAVLAVTGAASDDANETAAALLRAAEDWPEEAGAVSRVIPFSSARKYSGCVLEDGRSLALGAGQFVMGSAMLRFPAMWRTSARLPVCSSSAPVEASTKKERSEAHSSLGASWRCAMRSGRQLQRRSPISAAKASMCA